MEQGELCQNSIVFQKEQNELANRMNENEQMKKVEKLMQMVSICNNGRYSITLTNSTKILIISFILLIVSIKELRCFSKVWLYKTFADKGGGFNPWLGPRRTLLM